MSEDPRAEAGDDRSWFPFQNHVPSRDLNAFYWAHRYSVDPRKELLIEGEYPRCRYFTFAAYGPELQTIAVVFDMAIVPDPGNVNTFLPGADWNAENRKYTIIVKFRPPPPGSGAFAYHRGRNIIYLGALPDGCRNTDGCIVYRVYVPSEGCDETGCSDLPEIRCHRCHEDVDGAALDVDGRRRDHEERDRDHRDREEDDREEDDRGEDDRGEDDHEEHNHKERDRDHRDREEDDRGEDDRGEDDHEEHDHKERDRDHRDHEEDDRGEDDHEGHRWPHCDDLVWYHLTGSLAEGPAQDLFTTYMYLALPERLPSRLLSIRWKAPTFPATYHNQGITGTEDMRYWSMSFGAKRCGPTFRSVADYRTAIDQRGYVHLLVGFDAQRPPWATPENGVTWVCLGEEPARLLVYRNILPSPSFPYTALRVLDRTRVTALVMGKYVPVVEFLEEA